MKQNSKMPTRVESLKFYKTRDMREHEEKSKMAVKTFLENLNNRPKKKHHLTSTSQSSIKDKVSTRSTTSVLSAGTSLQSTQSNIKTTTQLLTKASSGQMITSVRSTSANSTKLQSTAARTITAQKIKLAQNNKNKSIKASVDSNCTTNIQCKGPLKFYKTKVMREHEEKSKWAVQTFWENLNNRSKKSAQSNENTMESQSSANLSAEISGNPISQTFSIQSTPVRSTEQARVATSGKGKVIGRSNKLSSESTSKASTQAFSQLMAGVNENGISYASSSSPTAQWTMGISVPDTNQPLAQFSNKRKHSGDGEIGSSKSIKITIPTTPKQKEFSMKVNLPNRPAPKVNNNIQSIGSGTSKNNGVKSLVQLCTMTLVSNKHRLYQLGNAPYHLLEPILKFCTDEELRELEEVNSRLIDEDMELWKRFLMQKLPDQPLPDNPEDYRRIYLDIIDEEKEKKERIIGNFRRAMAEEKAKKEARQIKILPVAPREPKRRPSGYQKLTTLQKIRREMIREGYVMFPRHNI